MRTALLASCALLGVVVAIGAVGGCDLGGGAPSSNTNATSGENSRGGDDIQIPPQEVWLEGLGVAVEVDGRSALRVYLRDDAGALRPLTAALSEVDPTARLIIGEEEVADFVRTDFRFESASGVLGSGQRLTVESQSDSRAIRRTLVLEMADAYPRVVLTQTTYASQEGNLEVDAAIEHDFKLDPPDPADGDVGFWSFQGGAVRWGEDYILKMVNGEQRRNEQPLNGGVPYCDIWSRGGGLGMGSASPVPRRLAIPTETANDISRIRFEWPGLTLPQGRDVEVGTVLIIAHDGDFYPGVRAFAEAMGTIGVAPPASFADDAYLQAWETYGYEENWVVDNITSRLRDLVELGVGVVTVDSGWYEDFSTGDYKPDPLLFPEGDAGFRALTDEIHAVGLKAKLWWQPGNVERDSALAAEHADWLVLDKRGEPPFAPDPAGNPNNYGDAPDEITDYMLCPAVPEVVEYHREFVRNAIEEWGFDGFKMDYIYGVPRCYAEDHGHASPDDAVEAYPDIYRAIAETAWQLRPHAMLNVCNCGVTQNLYLYPFQNQLITSDPVGSQQMRVRTKVLKAFFGPTAPVLCDHVELSVLINRNEDERAGPPDFASCLGVGAVLETKYTEFESDNEWDLYWTWLTLGKELGLSSGEYLGELYMHGFDRPEAHAVRKDDVVYYGFFVEPWGATYAGPVELRGLGSGTFRVERYVAGDEIGTVDGPTATLQVSFQNSLLLRAVPQG